MFNFFNDLENYKDRVVKNTNLDDGTVVDTCAMSDSESNSYETGIASPFYNDGDWIIVEEYKTKKKAAVGHSKWIAFIRANPDTLVDISQAGISRLCDINSEGWRRYKRHEQKAKS